MWKRKGENKNNGQKSGQWFRVTTDARAREREHDVCKRVHYLNASIRVFLSRGARSPPTLWIQLSPYLARQRRCGGRRSRGGRREEERNESKRIVWIAKMSAVWEAHRLIIIPNIISQQRWFHSFPSTFLLFFFPSFLDLHTTRPSFFFSFREQPTSYPEWIPFEKNGNVSSRGFVSRMLSPS